MRIGIVQLEIEEGKKRRNLEHALDCILEAPQLDLFILPELWNIGYFNFQGYLDQAEEATGETITRLASAAISANAFVHTGSMIEVDGNEYFNSSFLISPKGNIVARYRKIHLFGFGSEEPKLLSSGDQITVASTPLGNLGMATCYDLRFPSQFRDMVRRGANIMAICAAWPYPRIEAWQLFNRVRAIENQCFVVSANAAGSGGGTNYLGHSMIVNPTGNVIAQAKDEETILIADIDIQEVEEERSRFPAVRDFLKCNPPLLSKTSGVVAGANVDLSQ